MNGGVVGLGETACKGGGGGGVEAAEVTLETLRRKMSEFARERDWEQFHSPRNLLLALARWDWDLQNISTLFDSRK